MLPESESRRFESHYVKRPAAGRNLRSLGTPSFFPCHRDPVPAALTGLTSQGQDGCLHSIRILCVSVTCSLNHPGPQELELDPGVWVGAWHQQQPHRSVGTAANCRRSRLDWPPLVPTSKLTTDSKGNTLRPVWALGFVVLRSFIALFV